MLSEVLCSKTGYLTLPVVAYGNEICRLLPNNRFTSIHSGFRVSRSNYHPRLLKSLFFTLTVAATGTANRHFFSPSTVGSALSDQTMLG